MKRDGGGQKWFGERYGRGDAYAAHKRQLGRRELRRLNLAA